MVAGLAQRLRGLPRRGQIVAPLAVGNHVDHQIVRQAAEEAFGGELLYYEDYPYVAVEGALERVIAPGDEGWEARVVTLDEAAMTAKIEAVAAYASQLSSFFADHADLEAQLRSHAQRSGGERLWRKK
jgi:hypothetical protein